MTEIRRRTGPYRWRHTYASIGLTNGADHAWLAKQLGHSLQMFYTSEYGLKIGDIEGGLKFTSMWLMNCLAQICSPDRCYNLNFIAMRCFELTENLSFGATLGKLLSVKGIGRRTVQKLVDNDIKSLSGLSSASVDMLIEFGIAKSQAQKVLQYARRASR